MKPHQITPEKVLSMIDRFMGNGRPDTFHSELLPQKNKIYADNKFVVNLGERTIVKRDFNFNEPPNKAWDEIERIELLKELNDCIKTVVDKVKQSDIRYVKTSRRSFRVNGKNKPRKKCQSSLKKR